MTPDFNLGEELEAAVRDAGDAWPFIRRFAEAFDTPLVAGDGYSEDQLRAAESRLGFALPGPLRRGYALFGRRNDLTRSQDLLLTPDQVRVDNTGQVLVFRVENQHVAEWGVPLVALGEPDPQVVFRLDSFRESERAWQPFLERLSLACVEMALSEWLFSADEFADNRELDDETSALLDKRFSRLPMPDYPMWADPGGVPTAWFHRSGAILRADSGTWLWVRASSKEAIESVRRALPGEWLMAEE